MLASRAIRGPCEVWGSAELEVPEGRVQLDRRCEEVIVEYIAGIVCIFLLTVAVRLSVCTSIGSATCMFSPVRIPGLQETPQTAVDFHRQSESKRVCRFYYPSCSSQAQRLLQICGIYILYKVFYLWNRVYHGNLQYCSGIRITLMGRSEQSRYSCCPPYL